MSDIAIRVEGLGKRYRLGERAPYKTLRETLARAVRRWATEVTRTRPKVLRIGYFGPYARGDWEVGSALDLVVVVAPTSPSSDGQASGRLRTSRFRPMSWCTLRASGGPRGEGPIRGCEEEAGVKGASMLSQYMEKAMEGAEYKRLDDGTWFAEIPGFPGVWANAPTVEVCRRELLEVIEEWLLLKLRDHDPIPAMEGLEIKIAEVTGV